MISLPYEIVIRVDIDNYNQAVFQSGFGTSPHLFTDRVTARAMARIFAENVNCTVESHEYLKACLQNKTAEELVVAANKLFVSFFLCVFLANCTVYTMV